MNEARDVFGPHDKFGVHSEQGVPCMRSALREPFVAQIKKHDTMMARMT